MTVTFFTNYINHHQVPVADELYKMLGTNYTYVSMECIPQSFIDAGYPRYDRTYLLNAYENKSQLEEAYKLALSSDIVIIGSAPESLVSERLAQNKITFHYSERWFKKIARLIMSPRFWYYTYHNHIKFRNKNSYMLAASAFMPNDLIRIGAYPNKCFKWGYFTEVNNIDIDAILRKKESVKFSIMWCARFLELKHPELAIKLAFELKRKGYDFQLNMYGSGEELQRTKKLASRLGVEDVVSFLGNKPNEEILDVMKEHNAFLFTSDRNEGWGAVLNEAMSNGCTAVASNKIGSVPFLITNNVNGCIFRSEDLHSLTKQIEMLINNREKCSELARNAYDTMRNIWSPKNAANNLYMLFDSLFNGKVVVLHEDSPCSKAKFCNSKKIL